LIDRDTGEIARPGQANTMFELFLAESAPATDAINRQPTAPIRGDDNTLSTEIIFSRGQMDSTPPPDDHQGW